MRHDLGFAALTHDLSFSHGKQHMNGLAIRGYGELKRNVNKKLPRQPTWPYSQQHATG